MWCGRDRDRDVVPDAMFEAVLVETNISVFLVFATGSETTNA